MVEYHTLSLDPCDVNVVVPSNCVMYKKALEEWISREDGAASQKRKYSNSVAYIVVISTYKQS